MRAAGPPPLHIAGRGQDGGLQLHRGVVQSRPPPFWHPPPIPDCLRDADTQGNPNDLSDKPSTKPGQLQECSLKIAEQLSLTGKVTAPRRRASTTALSAKRPSLRRISAGGPSNTPTRGDRA